MIFRQGQPWAAGREEYGQLLPLNESSQFFQHKAISENVNCMNEVNLCVFWDVGGAVG